MSLPSCDELRDQLLTCGILPPAELEKAQRQAAESGSDLESVLRKSRVLGDSQLGALKAMRLGVSYCNISDFLPHLGNSSLIPEALARTHKMFPLFVCDGIITLVMEDPADLTGIDQVRRTTKQEVDVCLGGRNEIQGLIERAYGASKFLETSSVAESLTGAGDLEIGDDNAPVIRLVDHLVNESVRQGASDIHIEPGDRELRIRTRVDGVLRDVTAPPLGIHRALVSRVKVLAKLDISKTRVPQDGAIHHRGGDTEVVIRVSILPTVFGEAVVMRILRNASEAITLPDLGMGGEMLDRFHAIIRNAHGMILVSGPTGSGKSTTLYAAMKCIVSPQKNIIAIEDPVEYRTPAIRQVQVNAEANLTFAAGLRSILRQDPDVVMVGEIRDKETAHIAVQAALTGHLVLSTVHTNDSVGAVARLRDLGVAEYLISSSLIAVVAQRLCRKICPECAAPETPPDYLLEAVGLDPKQLDFQPMAGRGCRRCVGTGFVGRLGVFEIFEVREEYGKLIVQGASTEDIRAAARRQGMKFLCDDGVSKLRAGLTTAAEIARVAGRH